MLGIHRVGRNGAGYYLADLARELPVAQPGHWVGGAAEGLGLRGPVEADAVPRSAGGPPPDHRQSARFGPHHGGRRSTSRSTAPKSASVLFALGGDDVARRIVGVHTEAVAGAMAYMERHGVTAVRRSGPEQAVVGTSGAVAAVVHPWG